MTRAVNSLKAALGNEGTNSQTIIELFDKVKATFEAVENAHCKLVEATEDDGEYEKEEEWMAAVQSTFLESRLSVETFLKRHSSRAVTEERAIASESSGGGSGGTDTAKASDGADKQNVQGSHDSNVNNTEANNATASSRLSDFNEIKLALELPKTEYLKFDGNPVEYYSFITNFEVNIESKLSSNPAKLQHLKTNVYRQGAKPYRMLRPARR
ncbi:hypothetical protein HOLleu_10385 [Holothuria leucospilota]|uniref:Uncharacterized protein n=1 Tax=Holothuria leucospilota TaxID=206669 RepID=A0A9Q1CF31_HOLLE|nr:hypothetical protein HOLleu_10385 [Holothuria leucospilota]